MLHHIAFYRFTPIADLDTVLARIRAAADGLTGSVLVSEEGVNGTLAGPADLLDSFELNMNRHPELAPHFAGMKFRRTACRTPPFGRLKISRKRQLVEMGLGPVDASQPAGVLLDPPQWREFIARDDVVVLDNRNQFEYRLGHFAGAVDPAVQNFRDFPDYIDANLPHWQAQGKTIGMYCTGGIRCEKTAAWLAQRGLEVVQLKGGILNYFETLPDADRDWQGECFVFDNRISLDTRLQETGRDPSTVYEGEPDGPWRADRARRLQQAAVKEGVAPSIVQCPNGPWATVLDFLAERFPMVSRDDWQTRLAQGQIADTAGHVLHPEQAYRPGVRIVYYRSVQQEPPVPFEAEVLYANERFIVADKPHFLPVAPSGRYVTQTLLVRLRRQLGLDALMPAHRIDRETAGLVLLTADAKYRDLYQALFRRRKVHKVYEAVAPASSAHTWPLTLSQRIGEAPHFMQMQVMDATDGLTSPAHSQPQLQPHLQPNARATIDCIEQRGDWALYRLQPETGVRHQLRVQMMSLGLPIRNDRIYPVLQPESSLSDIASTYTQPLQLLAKELCFTDPVTGEDFHFVSRRALQWPPA